MTPRHMKKELLQWWFIASWWTLSVSTLLQAMDVNAQRFGTKATYNLPESEIQALNDLYDATDGDEWDWDPTSVQWDFTPTANPCIDQWQGVNCSVVMPDGYYHVVQLVLGDCDLYGVLPESLGNLTALEQLSLEENGLSGMIPSAMGSISTLQILNLSTNSLSGPIPDSLYQLSQLTTLDLSNNLIDGNLSLSISSLTSLVSLRLDNTYISGGFPSTINTLPVLAELSLVFTGFTGELLPLCDLISLQYLDLENNMLYGTIPECFTLLENLRVLRLGQTSLSGTLPVWLNTPQLEVLSLTTVYSLSGTLPPSLGSLAYLKEFDIYQCGLNGSIPDSFGGMTRLETFKVSENALTGTIPSGLLNLPHLVEARMAQNGFSGRLPSITVTTSALQLLELRQNQLIGPIPASFTNLAALQTMDLGLNKLTGPMPALCGLYSLENLALERNQITGSIHGCFGEFVNLSVFYAGSNRFDRTIPASLGSLPQLTVLNLSDNHLVGPIPSFFSDSLENVALFSNRLTGPIPKILLQLPQLGFLNLGNNALTGEIPPISALLLSTLVLNSNQLRGTLPASIANLTELLSLVLNDNQLTGTLDAAFNGSKQIYLNSVILNDNLFTGTLPAHLFELPSMYVFAASTNCFHGTLPTTICTPYFTALVLNGMNAAASCRHRIFPGLTSTYTIKQGVSGDIPTCLYTGFADTLQLSGNKFTGNLTDWVTTSQSVYVSSISLSHNALTGTIPLSFQNYKWHKLDLSYNKLTGTLSRSLMEVPPNASDQVLYLENNRLSGEIPSSIQSLGNISILGTNVFSCRLDESDLPAYDEGRHNYHCGSDGFNVPYYVWLGTICVFVGLAVAAASRAKNHAVVVRCRSWYEVAYSQSGDSKHLRYVLDTFHRVCMVSVWCAFYAGVLLLPVYVTLSHSYGTLTYSYAWSVSAAYLSGTIPIIPEFILWLFLLCSILLLYRLFVPTSPAQDKNYVRAGTATIQREIAIYALYLTINTFVVMGVNIAYLYIAVYKGGGLLVMAQVLLAFFKHGWGSFVMDLLLCRIVAYVDREQKIGSGALSASYTSLSVAATIVNNVIIPCIVVSVISPSCFYNVFSQAQEVQSDFSYSICTRYAMGYCSAVQSVRGSSSYSPPYEYSYQCSSGLITYYAPAFVNLCIVSTIVSPLMQLAVLCLYHRASPGTMWHKLLDQALPSLLKPLQSDADITRKAFLKPGRTFQSIITYLALLLTFGVVFPPLAVALAIAVVATVLYNRLRLGRFLCAAVEVQQLPEYLAIIEKECDAVNASAVLWHSLWMLVVLSCCFYALFLFDTLGDTVGFRGAYWVLIVMPLLSIIFYAAYFTVSCYSPLVLTSAAELGESVASPMQESEGIEMTEATGEQTLKV